ncbi:MAG: radical SAM protein, partial [Chloroflexota bacterium]|nr:radical SAM protein [Chloroflexota bacterium]
MSLRVTLVNPPQFTKYVQLPMGLATIAAVIEQQGYQVKIIDANALGLEPKAVIPYLSDADIVGLTAMTPTINIALDIARHVKQAKADLPVILGGAHATLLPEETLASAPEVDAIVIGEGEQTFVDLLRAFENNQPLDDVSAIAFRKDNEVVITRNASENIDLDSLPYLAYHLLPWHEYRAHPPHGRALPFAATITSRGCPYRCAYCSKPIFGNKFRAQSPERVVEELAYYQHTYGVKEIAFYDDVFTLNKKRAQSISEKILSKGLKLHWTCETRVNLVDKELLKHMKRAGCYAISYGIESASQDVLDAIHKDITPDQVEEAVHLTRQAGLQAIGYFMIGSPKENPKTIRESIQFAKKLKLDFAQFAITTPFPGTRLHEMYQNQNGTGSNVAWEDFIYEGTGNAISPVFENEDLSRDDLQYWAKRAYREFYLRPSYIWQRLAQIKSLGDARVS